MATEQAPPPLNILAALGSPPSRGDNKCRLATFLADIPEETEGRDELIRLVESEHSRTGYNKDGLRTLSGLKVASVLTQLGLSCTQNTVHDHRNHDCRCYR